MIASRPRGLLLVFAASAILAGLAAILVFTGIVPVYTARTFDDSHFGPPKIEIAFLDFGRIAGWLNHDAAPALGAFARSCGRLAEDDARVVNPFENLGRDVPGISLSGTAADWRAACLDAERLAAVPERAGVAPDAASREFFERHFQPIKITARHEPLPGGPARFAKPRIKTEALFTGYFEPEYEAAHARGGRFISPVFARPGDLVDVDLGAFRDDLAGERIAGRVSGSALVPYPDRQSINDGGLENAEVLAWMAPDDLFFLQIQGSGRLRFDDGTALRIGYAGQNGHRYTAIGRVLVETGAMALEDVTMQSIRAWLAAAAPEDSKALREENQSYVFFRTLEASAGEGPPGAQGVALTPLRSLAVDRRYYALGTPIWIDVPAGEAPAYDAMRGLMIAQDTGGAIRGPLRGDIFLGAGAEAGEIAGVLNTRGEFIVFLPRPVASRLDAFAK